MTIKTANIKTVDSVSQYWRMAKMSTSIPAKVKPHGVGQKETIHKHLAALESGVGGEEAGHKSLAASCENEQNNKRQQQILKMTKSHNKVVHEYLAAVEPPLPELNGKKQYTNILQQKSWNQVWEVKTQKKNSEKGEGKNQSVRLRREH